MKHTFIIVSIFIIFTAFISESLSAIPAFARKHRLSCKTCHAPYPRLKAFGEEFAGNGFTIKDQPATRYFLKTGDDQLSLIRDFPFAVRMDAFVTHNNSHTDAVDLSAPYNVKLLSGGSLAKNISYYFYFFFSERGKVVGLEDAFLMFGDVFGSGIDVSIGQFQVSDPLFKRELRLSFEDYHIYKAKPYGSDIDLTYDRGVMINTTIPGGPDLVLEILNGTGIGEADDLKNFDSDKYKNLFGRISQGLGDHFRVGAFGYYGKEARYEKVNEVIMYGGDATLAFGDVEFNVQYMERTDDNGYWMSSHPIEVKIRGGFAEMIYTPGGGDGLWFATALYNWVESDLEPLEYQSAAVHLGFLLRRNIRLMGEVNYIFKGIHGKHVRLLAGVIGAF